MKNNINISGEKFGDLSRGIVDGGGDVECVLFFFVYDFLGVKKLNSFVVDN